MFLLGLTTFSISIVWCASRHWKRSTAFSRWCLNFDTHMHTLHIAPTDRTDDVRIAPLSASQGFSLHVIPAVEHTLAQFIADKHTHTHSQQTHTQTNSTCVQCYISSMHLFKRKKNEKKHLKIRKEMEEKNIYIEFARCTNWNTRFGIYYFNTNRCDRPHIFSQYKTKKIAMNWEKKKWGKNATTFTSSIFDYRK